MSETELLSAVMSALRREPGCVPMRNNSGAARRGKVYTRYGLGTGSADIICVVRGRFLALECKVDKGKQSEEQVAWQRTVEAAGGRYAVVRSVLDAVQAVRMESTVTEVRRLQPADSGRVHVPQCLGYNRKVTI